MRVFIYVLCCVLVCLGPNYNPLSAQVLNDNIKTIVRAVKVKQDTAYISKPKRLTIRIFGSRNYVSEQFIDNRVDETLKYKANMPISTGFGLSYRGIGLSLGFRTGIVKKYEKYGETKSFDLSTQLFLPKIAIDIYGSYYRGYYVTDPSSILNNSGTGPYYIRPDLHTGLVGINGEYIQNAKKFSFSSPYSQTQYQKKSAGSFLFGAGIYAIFINADSSIVPKTINNADFFKGDQFNKSNIYSLVINGGYAYTLVIEKNYFVSGSLNLGGGLSYTTLSNTIADNRNDKIGTQLNMAFRLGTGYNSEHYFAGLQYIQLITKNMTPLKSTREDLSFGSIRLVLAKRFKFRQKNIDRAINKLGK